MKIWSDHGLSRIAGYACFVAASSMVPLQHAAAVSCSSVAVFGAVNLGCAGPEQWAVLSLNLSGYNANGTINTTVANHQLAFSGGSGQGGTQGSTVSNVGVYGGKIQASAGGTQLTGNVVATDGLNSTPSTTVQIDAGVLNGSVVQGATTDTLLKQARSDAISAAGALAGMAATSGLTFATLNSTQTISAVQNGLNVIHVNSINLGNNQTLTLDTGGHSNVKFVVDISGGWTMNSATVALGSGLDFTDVIYNTTGVSDLNWSGGLNNESSATGILLDPGGKIGFTPGLWNGEVIGGADITFASGATARNRLPEPNSLLLLLAGLLAVSAIKRRSSPLWNAA